MSGQKDKKEILVFEIFAKIFTILGFVAVLMSLILSEAMPEKNWFIYGVIVFVVFFLISALLKSVVKNDKEIISVNEKLKSYDDVELYQAKYNSIDEIKSGLDKSSYELLSNGFYFKRIATQGICYYAKFIESEVFNDVIEKEVVRFRRFHRQGCEQISGILFLSLPKIEEEHKDYVKDLSKSFLVSEIIPTGKMKLSVIVVLLDQTTKEAFYFDVPSSKKTIIYTYSCLVLKKIFKK